MGTAGPLVTDSTETDDTDDMTSSEGSTTVSEISTTAASTFDVESTTVNQDEDDMKEITTSGKDDEAVDPLEVSTSSGMDVTITDKDMVTEGITTEPEATTAAEVLHDDVDSDLTTRLPRIDDSQETTTSFIVEVPADTSASVIDSDSLVTETSPASDEMTVTSIPQTTMRVISVEDGGDSVTVVTMRPSTDVTMEDMEGSGSSDAATTMQSVMEDDTDHDSVTVPTSDSQETTAISTSDQDTTTTSSVSP